MPAILSGIGLNFALPLGVLCGLLALTAMSCLSGFAASSLPLSWLFLATVVGIGYGWLLKRVKGSEMMVSTYVGFRRFPYEHRVDTVLYQLRAQMAHRTGTQDTINVAGRLDKVLNSFCVSKSVSLFSHRAFLF